MGIGRPHIVQPGEGGHQHEQGRARQVEIGHQHVHQPEAVARGDEDVGGAVERVQHAIGTLQPFSGDTDIFITPGYRFNAVDMLMTNFHLPRSTLFMLVSAFAGYDTMRAAYRHAIDSGYRFYSYGDASLLFRQDS